MIIRAYVKRKVKGQRERVITNTTIITHFKQRIKIEWKL